MTSFSSYTLRTRLVYLKSRSHTSTAWARDAVVSDVVVGVASNMAALYTDCGKFTCQSMKSNGIFSLSEVADCGLEDPDIGRFYVGVISPISLDCKNSLSQSSRAKGTLIFVSIFCISIIYLIVVITIGDSKHGLPEEVRHIKAL